MASTQFQAVPINFGSTSNGSISGSGTANFPTNIINATAAIQAWTVKYNNHDNHVECVGAEITGINYSSGRSSSVTVNARLTLYDDDRHESLTADMKVVVIAECE